jgi:hypothetical protein
VREVHLAVLEELAFAVVGYELVHDALELTGRARLDGHSLEMPVDSDVGRRPHLQMKIGTAALQQVMHELGQIGHEASS